MDLLRLAGGARSVVTVPRLASAPSQGAAAPTLGDYLLGDHSDLVLLGTSDYCYVSESSYWECRQEPIEWFGLSISPMFHEVIERRHDEVDVRVLEATVQSLGSGKRASLANSAMESLLSGTSITGVNSVKWEEVGDGWCLSGEISLDLEFALPAVFPIPRGVLERVGSGIIRSTCKERGDAFLADLAAGYRAWAEEELEQRGQRHQGGGAAGH